jgi:hypothetical protein
MELDELEIPERRPGGARQQESLSGRATRIRRARPERRVPASREDDGRITELA